MPKKTKQIRRTRITPQMCEESRKRNEDRLREIFELFDDDDQDLKDEDVVGGGPL